MQAACTRFDLNIDAIIKYRIDTATIDTEILDISTKIKTLEANSDVVIMDKTKLADFVSVPGKALCTAALLSGLCSGNV
ncbi:MAG: hypothetical protein ABJ226_08585 [Roseobacter sp.]